MPFPIEEIPDGDNVSRLVEYPLSYRPEAGLIWENVFRFQSKDHDCDSIVWRKYAAQDDDVHEIGRRVSHDKNIKQERVNDRAYEGFITAHVGTVRNFRTERGHGFSVTHVPEDDRRDHGHLCCARDPNSVWNKADKAELKLVLREIFSPLVGCA